MRSLTNEKHILSGQEKEEVKDAFDKYKSDEQSDEQSDEPRENIWIECHSHFCNLKRQDKKLLKQDEFRFSCLLLANYLAVWGMQRNSFLMENDYHIFENVVKVILKDDYNLLWNTSYDSLNDKKEDFFKKLIAIRDDINNTFKQYLNRDKNISQTLITKILLGTISCCPAYDTNFCKGIPQGKDFYSDNSVRKLIDLVCDNDIFHKLAEESHLPIMKVVDMVYFKIGENKK
ncbi:MAG: hypothetical protein IJ542_02495 [Clostridia bacterium]|nr:hypothetical protein [Clostridia bacterium]